MVQMAQSLFVVASGAVGMVHISPAGLFVVVSDGADGTVTFCCCQWCSWNGPHFPNWTLFVC